MAVTFPFKHLFSCLGQYFLKGEFNRTQFWQEGYGVKKENYGAEKFISCYGN